MTEFTLQKEKEWKDVKIPFFDYESSAVEKVG